MNLFQTIYEELYKDSTESQRHNLEELGARMAKLVGRAEAWSYDSLRGVFKGNKGFSVTKEMEIALNMIMAQEDETNPLQALLVEITAFSINGRVKPGSIITGESKRCACGVLFVPYSNLQKYCHKLCPARPKRKTTKESCFIKIQPGVAI